MKKIKIFYFINIFCFLFLPNSKAQYIKAGIYYSTDIYTDIIPDDSLKLLGTGMYSSEANLILDVDHFFCALGGGSSVCSSASLDRSRALIYSQQVTCGVWPGVFKGYPVPVPLNYGDSISSNYSYHNYNNVIWGAGYGSWAYPSMNPWDSIGEHYIGFKLYVTNDTLFGWIRVEEVSNEKVVVKDYACNINPNVIIPVNSNSFMIYPNPANGAITINTDGLEGHLKLYSVLGTFVKDIVVSTGQTSCIIETGDLAEGVYILYSKYSGEYHSSRILIHHH
ncbi:MAG: T9SS type A sorting domain-containing protein [Bacteroidetes bacterium]|nr:T9SS type A sorting domain-containing protein [Bacteroidota bacterium]